LETREKSRDIGSKTTAVVADAQTLIADAHLAWARLLPLLGEPLKLRPLHRLGPYLLEGR